MDEKKRRAGTLPASSHRWAGGHWEKGGNPLGSAQGTEKMDILTALQMVGLQSVLNTVVGESIDRLQTIYAEATEHAASELGALDDQMDQLTPEERDEFSDGYLSVFESLDKMRELKERLCIVGLFTTFERFLRQTLQEFSSSAPARSKCIHRMHLVEMKKEFSDLGVSITTPDSDWQGIMKLKEVRNCITHSGGHPDEERAKKLRNCKILVDESGMVLAEGYFEESCGLIKRACERITEACRNALKERHKNTN